MLDTRVLGNIGLRKTTHRIMRLIVSFLIIFTPAWLPADEVGRDKSALTLMNAVSLAIRSAPEVALARETVSYKEAQVRIDNGEQDVMVSTDLSFENDNVPLTPYYESYYSRSSEITRTLTTSLTAEKELENGIVLSSSLYLIRDEDNLEDFPADNYSSVSFEITLPLLELWKRGLGPREKESRVDRDSSQMDLVYTVSQSAQAAALNFWTALAEKQKLENYSRLEDDTRTFLEKMTILVEKNEFPAADLERIKAELDAKTVNRIGAELSYYKAVKTLAVNAGIDMESLTQITQVSGRFPEIKRMEPDTKELIRFALEHRPDLAAGRLKEAYYKVLIRDAELDTLPDLDVSLAGGYQGLEETGSGSGYATALGSNIHGPTYSVALSFSKAIGNNAAGGALQQAKILLKQKELANRSLALSIASDVLTASESYMQSILALESQMDAVRNFKSALEKENISFRLQMSTLSDLMDARDDYYNSLNTLAGSEMAYARSIVNLRQACGDLIRKDGTQYTVELRALLDPEPKL